MAKQLAIPLKYQGEDIARENVRYINCWFGIATRERIGTDAFCQDCEFVRKCTNLYILFSGSSRLHPSAVARRILLDFEIESDYLEEQERQGYLLFSDSERY